MLTFSQHGRDWSERFLIALCCHGRRRFLGYGVRRRAMVVVNDMMHRPALDRPRGDN
jgi:hypothetical protein